MMARAKAQLGIGKALFELIRGDPAVQKEVFAQAAREAAEYWHKRMLERHFEPSAPGRYPGAYANRTAAYQKRKGRIKRHQRPMVWSGALLASQKSGYSLQSQLTKKLVRATIRLPNSRILNRWNARSKHDMRASIEAMNAQDFNELRNIMADVVGARLAQRVNGDAAQVVSTHVA